MNPEEIKQHDRGKIEARCQSGGTLVISQQTEQLQQV